MRVLIFYRPNSEYARITEDFIRDFKSRNDSSKIEVLNVDTRDGDATATLYDVVEYPAILVVQESGSVQKMWQGPAFPQFDEVAGYARA